MHHNTGKMDSSKSEFLFHSLWKPHRHILTLVWRVQTTSLHSGRRRPELGTSAHWAHEDESGNLQRWLQLKGVAKEEWGHSGWYNTIYWNEGLKVINSLLQGCETHWEQQLAYQRAPPPPDLPPGCHRHFWQVAGCCWWMCRVWTTKSCHRCHKSRTQGTMKTEKEKTDEWGGSTDRCCSHRSFTLEKSANSVWSRSVSVPDVTPVNIRKFEGWWLKFTQ